ncbi:unnamed protein product [Arabis nemorensis]|uniref:F-box domain-containing protein n=1 Tax=Arabis nemorensis TaxID=586526 RepID=A0A565BJA4_9BRAS|nr:unnamed protein product [Arabis nemorensis]
MASSFSMPLLVKDEEPRNWSELPPELTSSIMLRLGVVEILENAQKVCRAWRRASKEPSMWRKSTCKTAIYMTKIEDRLVIPTWLKCAVMPLIVVRVVWSKSSLATSGPILSSTTSPTEKWR